MSGARHTAGRPEAARVVWDWRSDRAGTADATRARRARLRGGIALLVGGTVGTVLWLSGHTLPGGVALGVSAAVAGTALVSPLGLYSRVERVMAGVGNGAAVLVNWATLAPLYFLFFAPFRLCFRRGPRDVLERAWDPRAPTYWKTRPDPQASLERYRRPF